MIRFFVLFIFTSFIFIQPILAVEQQQPKEVLIRPEDKTDSFTNLLRWCGKNNPCMIAKSVVFYPFFPWFQYPFDEVATNYQYKKFSRLSATIDLMLSKHNQSYSGYNMSLSMFKKWFGFDIHYETLNNADIDQRTFATHFVIRFMPRKHIQPFFAVGLRSVSTYKVSGTGFELSFFNYKVTFSRFFNIYFINYLAWIESYRLVHGIFGMEYYIYPTISVKSYIEIKYQFAQLIHGVTFGFSLQM